MTTTQDHASTTGADLTAAAASVLAPPAPAELSQSLIDQGATIDTLGRYAFGWSDSHLHRFALGGSPFDENSELFLCPYDVEEGEDDGTPAKEVRLDETLSEPRDVLQYCYDYGDSWDLIIAS